MKIAEWIVLTNRLNAKNERILFISMENKNTKKVLKLDEKFI